MPKLATDLTPIAIKNIKPKINQDGIAVKANFAVGGVPGLYIQVTPTGAKSWILRKIVAGRRRHFGLGSYPTISLKVARDLAREYVQQLDSGHDPFAERKKVKSENKQNAVPKMTFKEAAAEVIKLKEAEKSKRSKDNQWEGSLNKYAIPELGIMDVADIQLEHVLKVLRPIWEVHPEVASRVQNRIENILAWCAVHRYRDPNIQNPAQWRGYLDKVLPSKAKVKAKAREKSGRAGHSSLHYTLLPQFMNSLARYRIERPIAVDALAFLILTLPRSSELIGDRRTEKVGVTWKEIDFKEGLWVIPANRMKAGKEHVVVLSERAIDILQRQKKGQPNDLVFPGPKGDVPSEPFLLNVIKGVNENNKRAGKPEYVDSKSNERITTHGFRSSFKQWAAEKTDFEDEISEIALAHQDKNQVRAAYARNYQALEKRRKLMDAWADWCFQQTSKNKTSNYQCVI